MGTPFYLLCRDFLPMEIRVLEKGLTLKWVWGVGSEPTRSAHLHFSISAQGFMAVSVVLRLMLAQYPSQSWSPGMCPGWWLPPQQHEPWKYAMPYFLRKKTQVRQEHVGQIS